MAQADPRGLNLGDPTKLLGLSRFPHIRQEHPWLREGLNPSACPPHTHSALLEGQVFPCGAVLKQGGRKVV